MIERPAIFKGASVKLLQCQRDMYAFELGTAAERLISDPLNAVGQINIAQTRAAEKRTALDFLE